jgi:hypothetical protein
MEMAHANCGTSDQGMGAIELAEYYTSGTGDSKKL